MKKLWNTLRAFFLGLFTNAAKFEKFVREHVDDAVNIVEQIKFFVGNPIIITLVNLFPGKLGEKVKPIFEKVEHVLDEVLKGLAVGTECLALPTFIERLTCAVNYIRTLPKEEQDQVFHAIAVNYVRKMSVYESKSGKPIPKSTAEALVSMKLVEIKAEKAKAEKAA